VDEFVQKALEAAGNLGVAGGPLFFLLYWLERMENRKNRTAATELLRETITTMKDQATALDNIADHNEETRASLAKIAEALTLLSARRLR